MNNTQQLGETYETFVPAHKTDGHGRGIGYVVGLRDNGVEFFAWVQNARGIPSKYFEFGATQRSRSFKSQAAATTWAYATAKSRIKKLA